jgi:hypothetical protein
VVNYLSLMLFSILLKQMFVDYIGIISDSLEDLIVRYVTSVDL